MLQFLQRIFAGFFDNKSDLEQFIASRRPQSPADIDHLVKQWNHKNAGGWL